VNFYEKSQRSIINRGILKKKKVFSILSILLLISILLSSCIIKQSYKFTDVIIYSLKGDIHSVDFDGKKDRLLVSKDDVIVVLSAGKGPQISALLQARILNQKKEAQA